MSRYKTVLYSVQNVGEFRALFFSSRRRHTRFDCDWSSECALPISPEVLNVESGVWCKLERCWLAQRFGKEGVTVEGELFRVIEVGNISGRFTIGRGFS